MSELDRQTLEQPAIFRLLYVLTQLVGFIVILELIFWLGFESDFNWHPVAMTIGMVFLYGKSNLIYRLFRHYPKTKLKIAHATIHGLALLFSISGLVVAFTLKGNHIQSLHSWLGISAFAIILLQYLVGFVCFLFPSARPAVRAAIYPLHVFFGLLGFVLAVFACLVGINKLSDGSFFVSSIQIMLSLHGLLVVFLVVNPEFKRHPLPEEQGLIAYAPATK